MPDTSRPKTTCASNCSFQRQQSSTILIHIIISYLPLSLFPGQELVQCSNNLLQCSQVALELLLDLRIITAKLSVEVLPVWCGAHGGAEQRLDDERVVRLEGVAVGIAEGVGELLLGVRDVVAEGLGGEVEATLRMCQ